jgi:hypothetical protein
MAGQARCRDEPAWRRSARAPSARRGATGERARQPGTQARLLRERGASGAVPVFTIVGTGRTEMESARGAWLAGRVQRGPRKGRHCGVGGPQGWLDGDGPGGSAGWASGRWAARRLRERARLSRRGKKQESGVSSSFFFYLLFFAHLNS